MEEDSEDLSELQRTQQQNRIQREIGQSIFTKQSLKEKVTDLWTDIKDSVRNRRLKRVDVPEIKGSSGEPLEISIAGRNLQEFLPNKSYGFLGVTMISPLYLPVKTPEEMNTPRFNLATRQIEIVVKVEEGAKGIETVKMRDPAMTVLHEIGHAKDEEKNHRYVALLKKNAFRDIYFNTMPLWFNEETLAHIAQRGRFDTEAFETETIPRIRHEIESNAYSRLEFKEGGNPTVKEIFNSYNEDFNMFKEELVASVTNRLSQICRDSGKVAAQGHLEEAKTYAQEKINLMREEYRSGAHDFWLKTIAVSERQAWAEALRVVRILIKENGAKLWRGDKKELFKLIDESMFAHGEAGPLAIKRKSSKTRFLVR